MFVGKNSHVHTQVSTTKLDSTKCTLTSIMLNKVDGVVGGHEIGNGVILVVLLPNQSLLRLFCLLNVLYLCSVTQHNTC